MAVVDDEVPRVKLDKYVSTVVVRADQAFPGVERRGALCPTQKRAVKGFLFSLLPNEMDAGTVDQSTSRRLSGIGVAVNIATATTVMDTAFTPPYRQLDQLRNRTK